MKESLFSPQGMLDRAEPMLADGTMPTLDELLEAVQTVGREYKPKMLAARRGWRIIQGGQSRKERK